MYAGQLDRLIDIQSKTTTSSGSGEQIETWIDLVAWRPASMRALRANERIGDPQATAMEEIEFRIRWSPPLADLSPLDRIIYPSGKPALGRNVYDILAVHEIGRREGLQILTKRRTDVP